MSPFIFMMVAKGFSRLMLKAWEISIVKSFEVVLNGPILTHLQITDDVVV